MFINVDEKKLHFGMHGSILMYLYWHLAKKCRALQAGQRGEKNCTTVRLWLPAAIRSCSNKSCADSMFFMLAFMSLSHHLFFIWRNCFPLITLLFQANTLTQPTDLLLSYP